MHVVRLVRKEEGFYMSKCHVKNEQFGLDPHSIEYSYILGSGIVSIRARRLKRAMTILFSEACT